MIRGAVQMPGVVRGHQRAAVHYKEAWLELRLHRASFQPETSWRKEPTKEIFPFLSPLLEKILCFLVKMEVWVLTVFCMFLFCSSGVLSLSTQGLRYHAGLEASLALRNLSVNHRSRYPLYMMQLYRSFRMSESFSSVAVDAVKMQGEDPSTQRSDSVLSLMARSE